jgi:hypothetical protein
VKFNASSSRARSWASSSRFLPLVFVAFAACGGSTTPATPGETEEYLRWRADFFGTDITSNITGGVEKKKLLVELVGFPLSKTNDQWVELGVNGSIIHRFSLHSPDGRPLVLRYESPVRQGVLSVKIFYTGTNNRYSQTASTEGGMHITFTKGGPEGVTVTQSLK